MDALATTSTRKALKAPKTGKPAISKKDILADLRGLKNTVAAGTSALVRGHRIAWSRGIRKGISGRWDAVFVVTRPKTKKREGDSCVLLVDDAAELLFRELNPETATAAPKAKKA